MQFNTQAPDDSCSLFIDIVIPFMGEKECPQDRSMTRGNHSSPENLKNQSSEYILTIEVAPQLQIDGMTYHETNIRRKLESTVVRNNCEPKTSQIGADWELRFEI
jgi:hypothetical protein